MREIISAICWSLTFLALAIFVALDVLRGGDFNYFRAFVLVSPILLILLLRYRSHWHVLALLSIVAGRMRLQSYGLDRLTAMMLFSMFIIGVHILDATMNKAQRKLAFREPEDKAALLVALFLTLRFAWDRPGVFAFGAEGGGLINALQYVIGAWVYFAVQRIVAVAHFTRKQLQVSAWFVLFFFIMALVRTELGGMFPFTRAMGEQESWMLTAMLLALISTSSISARAVSFYATSFAFLFMASISTYRTRVLYILFEVLAVARHTSRLRYAVVILTVGGFVWILAALAFPDAMPSGMGRFLSLFADVEQQARAPGAYGWEDNTRLELLRIGWSHIIRNPFAGKGLALNLQEALAVLASADSSTIGLEMTALGGFYHNSFVSLAVIAGLPCALLFAFIAFSVPLKFSRMLRRIPDGDFRTWGIAVMAFYFGVMGMLLVNGGGREVFYCMIVTGYMAGMMKHKEACATGGQTLVGGAESRLQRKQRIWARTLA